MGSSASDASPISASRTLVDGDHVDVGPGTRTCLQHHLTNFDRTLSAEIFSLQGSSRFLPSLPHSSVLPWVYSLFVTLDQSALVHRFGAVTVDSPTFTVAHSGHATSDCFFSLPLRHLAYGPTILLCSPASSTLVYYHIPPHQFPRYISICYTHNPYKQYKRPSDYY